MTPGFTIPVLDHGFVRYVDHMGSDQRIVEAARVSYKSPSKGEEQDRRLLEYLWKNKHTSPFEMCVVTLNIKMPIFVARQYVRHRMQSMNEVSARYTELPAEFYIPEKWRKQDVANKQSSFVGEDNFGPDGNGGTMTQVDVSQMTRNFCEFAYKEYEHLLRMGVAREQARMVLPLNIYTEIYCRWDMKNLIHFITLRDDAHAQWEIQQYGKAIKQIVAELFPWTLAAYERYKWVVEDQLTKTEKGDLE